MKNIHYTFSTIKKSFNFIFVRDLMIDITVDYNYFIGQFIFQLYNLCKQFVMSHSTVYTLVHFFLSSFKRVFQFYGMMWLVQSNKVT